MLTTWWARIVCTGFVVTALAQNQGNGDTSKNGKVKPVSTRASVGRFSIPIHDDRIGDWKANITLQHHLVDLWEAAFDLWFDEDTTLPPNIEAPNLTALAKIYLSPNESSLYAQPLLDAANQTLQTDISFILENGCSETSYLNGPGSGIPLQIFLPWCYSEEDLLDIYGITTLAGNETAIDQFMNDTFFDLASEYVQAVYNASVLTQFSNFGALMGLGWNVECSDVINTVLESKDPWANAGSAAATTLMALLPTFLAFGNLFVPRSSEVFATSSLVGIGSSLYSFGLPVQSLSVIPDKQNFNLATFGLATLAMIASFAEIKNTRKRDQRARKDKGPLLEDLYGWSQENEEALTSMDEAKDRFAEIKKSVIEGCDERWHWWYLPALLVTAAQAIMFGLAIYPLLADLGTPRFLFTCYRNWTGEYLAITASFNALFRFCMWEVGYHERALIYALSSPPEKDAKGPRKRSVAERKLQELIRANSNKKIPSMETELPPLYPPLMSRVWASVDGLWRDTKQNEARYNVHLDEYPPHMGWWTQVWRIIINATQQTFFKNLNLINHMWSTSGWRIFKVISRSSTTTNQKNASRRYRPLVLLIHLSTAGRNFFMTLMSGFVEAALYLILTFFLASQWGGNLVITGFALCLLLLFTTVGRALGLIYVWISTKFYGLNVINCDSHEEILGSLRIVCSMQDVLVLVNGATYYNGYRLNGLPGFREWQRQYDAGEFDGEEDVFEGDLRNKKYGNGTDSDLEMASMESPRAMTTSQAGDEISTRIEIQRRQPFARMTSDQSESSDHLFPDHVKTGFGVSTLDAHPRAYSIESRSRMDDSE